MKCCWTFMMILLSLQLSAQSLHRLDKSSDTVQMLGKDLLAGRFDFHGRSMMMATQNRGDLSDYAAWGVGAGMGYYSPAWKGFHFGFSGFFVFQLAEHNLREPDPITGGVNRYEATMFDMHNLDNTTDLDRLEELYLDYEYKGLSLRLGRQKFHSPLLNEQDNRLRPNIFSGLSAEYTWQNWELSAAWFHAMTIRGTVDWYSVENSFGVYPFGRNPQGTPSDYKSNINSRGIGVLGADYRTDNWQAQAWYFLAENVFDISFVQVDYQTKNKYPQWQAGLQSFYQRPINMGGNADQSKTYFTADAQAMGLGGRLATKWQAHLSSINFNYFHDKGRFLFPREWGRELFYANLSRERFEGMGGLSALTLKYRYSPIKWQNLYLESGAGIVNTPDINNFALNKYGQPSYYHFTALIDYRLEGYFTGLDLKFLVAHKRAQSADLTDSFRINRVDMWNYTFTVDYVF